MSREAEDIRIKTKGGLELDLAINTDFDGDKGAARTAVEKFIREYEFSTDLVGEISATGINASYGPREDGVPQVAFNPAGDGHITGVNRRKDAPSNYITEGDHSKKWMYFNDTQEPGTNYAVNYKQD